MPKTKTKAKRTSKARKPTFAQALKWGRQFEALARFAPSIRARLVTDVWALAKNRDMEFKDLAWVTAELLWQIHIFSEETPENLLRLQREHIMGRLRERSGYKPKTPDDQRRDTFVVDEKGAGWAPATDRAVVDQRDEVLQRECRCACSKTAPIPPNP